MFLWSTVLDLGLPDIDGLGVIAHVRREGSNVPIIVLSSRAEKCSKMMALDLGADDYLATPFFGMDELLARVRVAARHRLERQRDPPAFRIGELTVDLVRRTVAVGGKEVKVSRCGYDLLRLLVSHAGKVLTRGFIQREVWGTDSNVQYLRIYIRALCQKIEKSPERPYYILTETGVGDRLRAPE